MATGPSAKEMQSQPDGDEALNATPIGKIVAGLNDQQRLAVLHDDRPLLVVAGAGTGKTRTLVYRTSRLIEDGVPPGKILLLTFTNKAAREMRTRLERMLGKGVNALWLGTFHAICARILRHRAGCEADCECACAHT